MARAMTSRVARRQNAKRGRTKGHLPILLLVLLFVVTAAGLSWAVAAGGNLSGREFTVTDGLDPRATRLSEPLLAGFGDENSKELLSYQINQVVTLSDGGAAAPLCIASPIQNATLLRAEIILDETGDTLFSSGLLLPGSQIEEATLSQAIDPGEYAATAWFYAVDPIDQALLGRVSEPITIAVLS